MDTIYTAVVRFNKNGKHYEYFIPKNLQVKVGQYVIVPDKISDKRYETAQCVGINTRKNDASIAHITEFIVDVVDSEDYEKRKECIIASEKIEHLLQTIKDMTKDMNVFGDASIQYVYDTNYYMNDKLLMNLSIDIPIKNIIINKNKTPLLAEAVKKGII